MGSIWETRFNNHPLWALINQITGELERLVLPDDVDAADSLSRLQWLVETIQDHRQEDPRRYSTRMLDNVHIHIAANVQAHLAHYARDSDGCAPDLRAAADGIDAVLEQLGTWPALSPKGIGQAQSVTITAYKRELEKEIKDSLEKQVSDAMQNYRAHLNELEETLMTAALGASRDLASLEEMRSQGANVLAALTQQAVADSYGKNARNKAFAGWTWDLMDSTVGGVPLVILLTHYFSSDSSVLATPAITLTRLGIAFTAIGLGCPSASRAGPSIIASPKVQAGRSSTAHRPWIHRQSARRGQGGCSRGHGESHLSARHSGEEGRPRRPGEWSWLPTSPVPERDARRTTTLGGEN